MNIHERRKIRQTQEVNSTVAGVSGNVYVRGNATAVVLRCRNRYLIAVQALVELLRRAGD